VTRSSLLLAAALAAATGVNVVLWSAVVDLSGVVRSQHAELMVKQARLRQAQADVVRLWPDHPPASVFKREVFPAPIEDPALTEVSGG
jgi:hypothetical protein